MNIQQRMMQVKERIQRACERSGRAPEEVNIIAVTKYISLEATGKVLESGCEHIGENRWQDASHKWEALGHQGTWHFIGHLQTNKVKDVLGKFKYIHSLDRLSLAMELNKRAEAAGMNVSCFIQVNVSGEESKYGLSPGDLTSFAETVREQFPRLDIVGLMTMAPFESDPEHTRPVFRELRALRDELNRKNIWHQPIRHLSMGMSNDFEVAVEEGATWVRLGSVLVGNAEE